MHANKREEIEKVYSGDIAAAVGLKVTTTGDTLCDERKEIMLEEGVGYYTLDGGENWDEIPEGALASMNLWAFQPGFIDDISESFPARLREGVEKNPLKFEETISEAVQNMMDRGKASVVVLPTNSTWFGMTYQEDIPSVVEALSVLTDAGVYPDSVW